MECSALPHPHQHIIFEGIKPFTSAKDGNNNSCLRNWRRQGKLTCEEESAHTRNSQLSAQLSGPKVVGSKKATANSTVKSYPRWRSLPSDSEQGFIFDHSTETFPGRARL